jgi:hypothetical protein
VVVGGDLAAVIRGAIADFASIPSLAAFGRILQEGLTVYESLGFKTGLNIKLQAQIDPSGTQLWTDGESEIFLHLQSREALAPDFRTGVFNLYDMYNELGHIAMYRNLKSLMGLPPGVGEGWT